MMKICVSCFFINLGLENAVLEIIKYLPDVVTNTPVTKQILFPNVHPLYISASASDVAPNVAIKRLAAAKLAKMRLYGVRTYKPNKFECN